MSIFDPEQLRLALHMPAGAKPVAILCLSHVAAFYPRPMLETEGWDTRRELADLVFENTWAAGLPAAE